MNEIREALSFVPADDRDTWVRMGMSVKSAMGEEGFPLWDEWARQSESYSERSSRDVWKSIRPDGGVGPGSLFFEARARGWQGTMPTVDPEQQAQRQRDQQEARKRQQAEYRRAADRAERLYENAADAPESSPYLKRKGISAPDGVRRIDGLSSTAFGFTTDWPVSALLVPMRDASGTLWSLQLIPDRADQKKLFMRGGRTGGCFHIMGEMSSKRIVIAEGLATAQSAREASGWDAVVAFSAGNLAGVAETIRRRNAAAEILILGDDDEAGRKAARSAAAASGGRVVFPGNGFNDFNDLHVAMGLEAVREAMGINERVDSGDWRERLSVKHRADGTQVIPSLVANLALILEHAEPFQGRIQYNEFSCQISIDGADMDDSNVVDLKIALERDFIQSKISTSDVIEAASVVARAHPVHPVREYLNSLEWDGVERIFWMFPQFAGTPEDEYHMMTAHSLLVSAVARVMNPGVKVDTMVILHGAQGAGKTRLWAALFGDWSSEVTSSLNDKDFFAGLRGVWAADFGELDQFSRAETTRIKQVLTQTHDHFRPHYGRAHKRHARQCIFVGGTNNDSWQTDPTGARRFLPVHVRGEIDIEGLLEIRDQLWAEAVARWRREEPWWKVMHAEEHQDEIYVGDSWEEIIGGWLVGRDRATVAAVLTECLDIEPGRQTRSDQTRVGSALRRLGWRAKQEAVHGARVRVYRPKKE